MFKKNIIGIIVAAFVFAGFYAGYTLGKSSGSSASRVGTGMSGGKPPSSSSTPASQKEGMRQGPSPQSQIASDGQWVKSSQDESSANLSASVVNVAWAESLETGHSEGSRSGSERQKYATQHAMDETMPVALKDQTSPATDIPVQQEEPEELLIHEQASTSAQTFYGTVVPYAEANVQSRQGGTITFLKGKEGDSIGQGDVVVRFDDRDAQLELQEALASKNSAQQAVNQAESNFQTIQSNMQRYQKLYDDGFVSKQEVDDLQNQLTSAVASLNSAKESVNQSDVQIKMLQNTLQDFRVKAPISGLINEKNYNLGEVYQGNSAIYHVIDIEQIYVEVEVPETYLKNIREGMTVNVIFDALGEQASVGTLETILPSGTTDNRNFTAKVLVQNQNFAIKPGMFARIEIDANPGR